MRKSWYVRVIAEGYQFLIAGVMVALTGAGVGLYLSQLITGRSYLDNIPTAPARMTRRDWLTFSICAILLVPCSIWFLRAFADLLLPGERYEGIVDKIDLVTHHTVRSAVGFQACKLTSGQHIWEFSRHAKPGLSVGNKIRVTYRRGSGAATHIWRQKSTGVAARGSKRGT